VNLKGAKYNKVGLQVKIRSGRSFSTKTYKRQKYVEKIKLICP